MSQSEVTEHASYLVDKTRMEAYDLALRQVIEPGRSVVLDLGAGTGILGLLAARAGARRVYSVDSGSIIATTEAIAKASGLADRMVFLHDSSTNISLPEKIDVAVCDQIGGMVYDAGVLEYFADVRRRLLSPDGVFVPGSFELLAAPAEASDWDDRVGVWGQRPGGFDLGPMLELAVNTEFRVDVSEQELLGPAVPWARVAADCAEPIKGRADLVIDRPGRINGILGMFLADLAPPSQLTNCPLLPHRFDRWQNLYPLRQPVPVAAGDRVTVSFDIRPAAYIASWAVEVHTSGGRTSSRGSTVLGQFLTPGDLDLTSGAAVADTSPRLAADRHILAQVDGKRTVAAIVESTWASHGPAFASRQQLQHRVQGLLAAHVNNRA